MYSRDFKGTIRLVIKQLEPYFKELSPRHQELLRKFYSVGVPHESILQIADRWKITRERVTLERDKALKCLLLAVAMHHLRGHKHESNPNPGISARPEV